MKQDIDEIIYDTTAMLHPVPPKHLLQDLGEVPADYETVNNESNRRMSMYWSMPTRRIIREQVFEGRWRMKYKNTFVQEWIPVDALPYDTMIQDLHTWFKM